MNKLVIDNGGMPLHGNDFRFIDAGIREAIKGLLYGICPENCILGGLFYTKNGTQYVIQEGFVCLGFEVRFVPSQTLICLPNQIIEIHPDDTWDINGLDVFANNQSNNTYQVRRAKCVAVTNVADTLELVAGPFYRKELNNVIVSVSLTSSNQFSPSVAPYQNNPPLRVYKDGNLKNINGVIDMGNSIPNQQDTLLFNISDAEFRPTRPVFQVISVEGGGGEQHQAKISILPNGNVFIYKYDSSIITYEYAYINISFV